MTITFLRYFINVLCKAGGKYAAPLLAAMTELKSVLDIMG